MEQSLYLEYVQKYFPQLVLAIVEKLNDKKDNVLPYLFKQLLTPTFSVDGRWQTLEGMYTRVAADVVAMDSPLPLKKRDSLGKASGEIPKLGMELFLNEKQMSDIDAMIAQGMDINTIVGKIFEDAPRVIAGIYERLEDMFLQGLSSGVAVAEGTEKSGDNVGTGIRIDYGYFDDHKFNVAVLWSDPDKATPIDDIELLLKKAREDGNVIVKAYADKTAIDSFCKAKQVREQFAFTLGFTGTNIPVLGTEQASQTFQSKWGFPVEIVDRAIRTEANGVQTVKRPWKEGTIVFVTSTTNLGGLVWTRLAEMNHPVSGVNYQTVDKYMLVSKYRENRPSLREYTTSQARVVPVIANPYGIYTLDSKVKD